MYKEFRLKYNINIEFGLKNSSTTEFGWKNKNKVVPENVSKILNKNE